MAKLKPYIFRQAAELINRMHDDPAGESFSCHAIEKVCKKNHQSSKPYINFFEIFQPTEEEFRNERVCDGIQFSTYRSMLCSSTGYWSNTTDNLETRRIALLLCAEMIKNP